MPSEPQPTPGAPMARLLALARAIDRLSRRVGGATSWLALAMVVVGAANAVLRYAGRLGGVSLVSNAYLELQWYMFSLLFLLPAAWALESDGHVRVDVFYSRLPPRGQAGLDLVGHLLLLFPFTAALLWLSWPSVWASWAVREGSADPGGLPRYPLKMMVLVALALVLLQGVSLLIQDLARLRGILPPRQRAQRGEEPA
jgi:TRAP-type mannitol/chloroaromatic compound transport system permease small subunit